MSRITILFLGLAFAIQSSADAQIFRRNSQSCCQSQCRYCPDTRSLGSPASTASHWGQSNTVAQSQVVTFKDPSHYPVQDISIETSHGSQGIVQEQPVQYPEVIGGADFVRQSPATELAGVEVGYADPFAQQPSGAVISHCPSCGTTQPAQFFPVEPYSSSPVPSVYQSVDDSAVEQANSVQTTTSIVEPDSIQSSPVETITVESGDTGDTVLAPPALESNGEVAPASSPTVETGEIPESLFEQAQEEAPPSLGDEN